MDSQECIEITSTIVKKVLLWHNLLLFKVPYIQYRYFFDIHNSHPAKGFEGSITVNLYRDRGKPDPLDLSLKQLGIKVFKDLVPARQHKVVWVDLYTGPVHVHGKYGVTHFDYIVQVEGQKVVNGQELITQKYEDLS